MPSAAIEEFAALLVSEVRDRAISGCDMNLRPDANYAKAKRWREAAAGDAANAISLIVPDYVDATIAALLKAIDNGAIQLLFRAPDGATVDLTRDGLSELLGWYMGSPGWRALYSQERFIDDLADLSIDWDDSDLDDSD